MLKHATAGALAAILATTAMARADVDAPTIWADWQEVYARLGAELAAASEDYAGGTLTLRGVTVTSALGGTEAETVVGTVTMVEAADGTVRIALPAEVAMSATGPAGEIEQTQAMTLTQDGLEIVASETDGVRTYEATARSLTMAMTQQTTAREGAEAPEGEMPPTDVTLTLDDVASTYRSGLGDDAEAFEQDATAAAARIAVDVRSGTDPLAATHDMRAVTLDIAGRYGPAPTGPVETLADSGIAYEGTIGHGGSTLAMAGSVVAEEAGAEAQTWSIDGTSEGARMAVGLAGDRFSYAVTSTAPALTVEATGVPMPIAFRMAEIGTTVSLPAVAAEAAAPFSVAVALRELVVDDAVWAMFDPTGQLPREPATLTAAVDGTAVVNVDLMGDPEAMAGLDGPPGELRSLDLTDLTLELAGAALRGSGALAFEAGAPVPQPVGAITLVLEGGFALLDRLVALGALPAEQAAFVKGMSGAVARSVGEDALESVIEFTPGGGITANGLPLR